MISALWQVASRQWGTHRLRVAMTTLGIALGVGVFFAIRTANSALLESLTLTVEHLAGKSTLEVTAGETGFPEETLDTVRATPGVQLAEPVIEVIVHTAFQDEGNLMILGVDTTGDQQLRQYQFCCRGLLPSATDCRLAVAFLSLQLTGRWILLLRESSSQRAWEKCSAAISR